MAITLTRQAKVLFIGDSITDAGRFDDPEKMGSGYVQLIRDYWLAKNPAAAPTVINTGISGNRVIDLQERWENDALAHGPDILSIKIGINDVWHGLGGGTGGIPIEQYKTIFRDLLQRLQIRLPKCQLVLCEPSVIWPPAPREGNELLKPYVKAVNDLATQFHAYVVPLHGAFERAREIRPDVNWAPDGVHPSSAGHMLIAHTWLKSTGLL